MEGWKRWNRLKRWVAPGPRALAGERSLCSNTGTRPPRQLSSILSRALTDARASRLFDTARELFNLAWPIATAMLGETALGLVDTKLVGGLGASALGGVGMATTLLFFCYSMVLGLMRGVKVRAAYVIGEGRPEDAPRYAYAGVLFGVSAGLIIALLARDLVNVLSWLGINAETVFYAREYFGARATGAVASCAVAALIQHRQGIGDSRTPMLVGLFGNVVNASLSYGLIYGRFGLPALGVRGAGYGTVVAESLELLILLALLVRGTRAAKAPSLSMPTAMREVATLGLPTGLHFGLEIAAFTTFTALLGSLGAAQIAAHHIAMNTIRASFLPGVAVAEAASVLVARSLGQVRLDEADRVTRAALLLGVGFMTMCGVIFGLFGAGIAAFFASDAEVISVARRLLLVAAVFQTLDAANMVLRGALRGAKDVRWVAAVGPIVVWCCVPGAALVLGRWLGWGAFGGWCGFVLETSLGALLMWRRWTRGPWRRPFAETTTNEAPALAMAPAR